MTGDGDLSASSENEQFLANPDGGSGSPTSPSESGSVESTTQAEPDEKRRGRNLAAAWAWMKSYAFFVYASQALSAWGDRMWNFAVGLYLIQIEENSLRLTAIYGLSITASVFFFGAVVGRWVDRMPRLKAVRVALFLQNTFVLLNASTMCALLIKKDAILEIWDGLLYLLIQILIILLGIFAKLASVAQTIAVQKDWIVVIAGQNKANLADMNASIRRIDLTINILAPVVVGQIMTFVSMFAAGIFIASWNLVSMFVEYGLLHRIYKRIPALAEKRKEQQPSDIKGQEDKEEHLDSAPLQEERSGSNLRRLNPLRAVTHWLQTTWRGLKVYRSYDIFWAGLGLATLYMTVMGFDSITSGYGYVLGVPEYMIGIFRAIGSLAGIVGTVLFTFMQKRVGIVRSGLYSLMIQISMLTFCVASIFAPGSPFDPTFVDTRESIGNVTGCLVTERSAGSYWSAGLFFGGMILSRIGLWSFDLVTSQQIQETVAENHRGIFNGIQSALQNYFEMIRFVLVITLPCPESFGYLIIASFLAVCLGAWMYSIFSYKARGHILPHVLKAACVTSNGRGQRMREEEDGIA